MPQEFLASFAVDIDESGVNRLQQILQQNRDLAKQVSGAFDQAKASMEHFLEGVSQEGLSGLMSFLGSNSSGHTPQELATAPAENLSVKGAVKKALVDELQLGDGTERGFALDTLLLSTIAQGTRNASDLRKLPSRSDYGLSSASPAFEDSEDYASFQYQASELLRQPIAEAREQMQHALDAEAEGVDATEYVNKVIEVLREPLQQVQELYDSFSFGEDTGGENIGSGFADLTARIDAFLNEAAKKKLVLSADASGIISAVNSAVSQARSIVSNADLTLSVQAESESSGGLGDLVGSLFSGLQLSAGGRFTSPTRAEIAEDGGTEYVIPVNREDRAVPLVRSLLSELSASARESLRDAMGSSLRVIPNEVEESSPVTSVAGHSGRSEESPFDVLADLPDLMSGALASAAPVSVVNQPVNNQNVSAPVNIRVEASAADPEAVGRSIYNTAERYLLRTLEGVSG